MKELRKILLWGCDHFFFFFPIYSKTKYNSYQSGFHSWETKTFISWTSDQIYILRSDLYIYKSGKKNLERNFLEKYLSRSSFLVKLQAFSHDFQENQFNEQLEMNAPEEKV